MRLLANRRGGLWLAPAGTAAALTVLIMQVLPADRTLHGLGDFILKISPVVFAVMAIALLPRRHAWAPYTVLLGCGVFLGLVDSASFIQVSRLVDAAVSNSSQAQFSEFYRFSTFVDAFVVLFGLLAYRMGGGSTEKVLRLGFATTLLLVSGLNDLTMWAMYAWPDGVRPDVFSWASHVAVFIGREPHLSDMLVFLAVHLSLVALVMTLPLPRSRSGQLQRGQQPTGRPLRPTTLAPGPLPPER
jgi:hypothetical protein